MNFRHFHFRLPGKLTLIALIGFFFIIQANKALAITVDSRMLAAPFHTIESVATIMAPPHNCKEGTAVVRRSWVFWTIIDVTYPEGYWHVMPFDREDGHYYFCPFKALETLKARDTSQDVEGAYTYLIWAVNELAALCASIGIYFLKISSSLLSYMLGLSSFITNPMVMKGWPFVQGFANIGFIIALLYIALGTTLEPTGISLLGGLGVKRLLPRLLAAALLINFSLVVGGILIDASRVFMAIMVQIATAAKIENIGLGILKTSGIMGVVFKDGTHWGVTSNLGSDNWEFAFMSVRATIMVWALAIGMTVMAFGMFVRYIILILLLIASPMAYLLIVLPQTASLGKRWWSEFIKWVLYGPIALFILVLVVGIGRFVGKDKAPNSDLEDIFSLVITVAMLIIAATVGKTLGGYGSSAVMSFAGRTKRAAYNLSGARLAVAAGRGAITGAGRLAAAPVKYVGQGIVNQGKDFTGVAKKSIVNAARGGKILGRVGQFIAGPERDKEGKLKDGQSSPGKDFGKYVFGGIDPKEQAKKSASATVQGFGTIGTRVDRSGIIPRTVLDPTSAMKPFLNGANLSEGHIARAWSKGDKNNIKIIAQFTEDGNSMRGLAQNKDYLRDLQQDDRRELLESLSKNEHLNANDKSRIADTILQKLKEIDKE